MLIYMNKHSYSAFVGVFMYAEMAAVTLIIIKHLSLKLYMQIVY